MAHFSPFEWLVFLPISLAGFAIPLLIILMLVLIYVRLGNIEQALRYGDFGSTRSRTGSREAPKEP